MKACLVFEWDQYYPRGGWNDLIQQFDTFEEAQEYHKSKPLEWGERRQVVIGGYVVKTWRDDD